MGGPTVNRVSLTPEQHRITETERAIVELAQRSSDSRRVIERIHRSRLNHPFPVTPAGSLGRQQTTFDPLPFEPLPPGPDFDFVDRPQQLDTITNARPVIEALRAAHSALEKTEGREIVFTNRFLAGHARELAARILSTEPRCCCPAGSYDPGGVHADYCPAQPVKIQPLRPITREIIDEAFGPPKGDRWPTH